MTRPPRAHDAVEFHSSLAKDWSTKYKNPHFFNRYSTLSTLLGDLHAQAWLDAGCGTGDLSLLLADHGANVTSIEKSEGMLENCLVPAIRADIEALPFSISTFDGVLCSSVLEYLSQPEVAVKEMHRVTRSSGRLLLSVPNSLSIIRALQRFTYTLCSRPAYMEYSRTSFTQRKFTTFLRRNGFSVKATYALGTTDPIFRRTRFGPSLLLYDCVRLP